VSLKTMLVFKKAYIKYEEWLRRQEVQMNLALDEVKRMVEEGRPPIPPFGATADEELRYKWQMETYRTLREEKLLSGGLSLRSARDGTLPGRDGSHGQWGDGSAQDIARTAGEVLSQAVREAWDVTKEAGHWMRIYEQKCYSNDVVTDAEKIKWLSRPLVGTDAWDWYEEKAREEGLTWKQMKLDFLANFMKAHEKDPAAQWNKLNSLERNGWETVRAFKLRFELQMKKVEDANLVSTQKFHPSWDAITTAWLKGIRQPTVAIETRRKWVNLDENERPTIEKVMAETVRAYEELEPLGDAASSFKLMVREKEKDVKRGGALGAENGAQNSVSGGRSGGSGFEDQAKPVPIRQEVHIQQPVAVPPTNTGRGYYRGGYGSGGRGGYGNYGGYQYGTRPTYGSGGGPSRTSAGGNAPAEKITVPNPELVWNLSGKGQLPKDDETKAKIDDFTKKMSELKIQQARRPTGGFERSCYRCEETGHSSRYCESESILDTGRGYRVYIDNFEHDHHHFEPEYADTCAGIWLCTLALTVEQGGSVEKLKKGF
ncbi:hypothetical protein HK097_005953, partial [Rhizophlyctis rosea]